MIKEYLKAFACLAIEWYPSFTPTAYEYTRLKKTITAYIKLFE